MSHVRVRFTEDRRRMFEVEFQCPGPAPCPACTSKALAYPSTEDERKRLDLVFALGPRSSLVLSHSPWPTRS